MTAAREQGHAPGRPREPHGWRTSIVVAHRLSTVAALDRIVVLEEGAVVEGGTHAELSRAGGTYESLWDRQTGAFLEAE